MRIVVQGGCGDGMGFGCGVGVEGSKGCSSLASGDARRRRASQLVGTYI